jgi:alanine-synthesizing transaminase
MFSERSRWDFTPNLLTIERGRSAFRDQIIDLTVSNPTMVGLDYPADLILDAFARRENLTYEPAPAGLAQVRELVAETYRSQGVPIHPRDIVLTASSSEAYSFLLKLLCDAGDMILVPQPSYPLFDDLAKLESVRTRGYALHAEDDWHADVQALEQAVDDRVRAVFVVSPNNPTGSYLVRQERDRIERIAAARGLAIVVDEVFGDYVWHDDPSRVRCAASEATVLTFSLGGLSKAACLPQMKLGWIVVGGPVHQKRQAIQRLEMIGDTYLSVGTPVQHAAAGLWTAGERVRASLRDRVRANLAGLAQTVDPSSGITVLPVRAGWYAVLRLPAILSGEAWSALLVRSDGVLTHPGEFFGFGERACLVLSLIQRPEAFREGVARIVGRVRSELVGPEGK